MNISEISFSKAMGLKAFLDVKGEIDLLFQGSSMAPTIPEKAVIHVEKVSDISLGNIYVFYLECKDTPPRLVCHRLQHVENGIYYFRGDNRKYLEEVNKNAIIGAVRRWTLIALFSQRKHLALN